MTFFAALFLFILYVLGLAFLALGGREAQIQKSLAPLYRAAPITAVLHGFIVWALIHV